MISDNPTSKMKNYQTQPAFSHFSLQRCPTLPSLQSSNLNSFQVFKFLDSVTSPRELAVELVMEGCDPSDEREDCKVWIHNGFHTENCPSTNRRVTNWKDSFDHRVPRNPCPNKLGRMNYHTIRKREKVLGLALGPLTK